MFDRIMIPVDLAHADSLLRPLTIAAGLAERFDAAITLVGLTAAAPSEVAHSPAEYRAKLDRFAQECTDSLGTRFGTLVLESHDPAVDLDRHLADAAAELGADLIVMASHVPRFGDWLIHSHARWLVAHTSCSMFIVR